MITMKRKGRRKVKRIKIKDRKCKMKVQNRMMKKWKKRMLIIQKNRESKGMIN